ncbi:hypothetical protein Syun_019968 [Stephania yunnanensis]
MLEHPQRLYCTARPLQPGPLHAMKELAFATSVMISAAMSTIASVAVEDLVKAMAKRKMLEKER